MNTKRILSMVLAIVLTVSLFAGISGTAFADDSQVITHTVTSGQYLQKICKSYGLSYDACKKAIMLLNGFTSNTQLNRIYPGQTIKLPASDAIAATVRSEVVVGTNSSTTSSTSTASTTTTSSDSVAYYLVQHTVKSGETLAGICNSLGSSYAQYANTILTINGISSVTHVYAGKVIYIPVATKPTTGTYYSVVAHKVVSGETATAICNGLGINYSNNRTLVDGLNDGYNLNKIKVGQTIYVPTTKTINNGGNSGSGTTPSTSTGYAITINSSGTGTAYATVNGATVTTAAKDAKVVINATTATSSVLKIEKVQRADTKAALEFNENTDSFVMPNCAVIVTVSFTQGKAINKRVVSGFGSFETYVNDAVASFSAKGKIVTVKTSPDSGYVTESVTVDGATVKKVSNNTYTFTMPDGIAEVKVTFKAAQYYKADLIFADSGKKTSTLGSTIITVDDVKTTDIAEGAVVVVKATPITGYIVKSVKYGTKEATVISDNVWSFEMPASATTVTVEFARNDNFNIQTNLAAGYGSVTYHVVRDGKQINTVSAKAGETVYAAVSSPAWWTISIASIKYANGTAKVAFSGPNTDGYYEFVMPAASVVVTTQGVEDGKNKFVIYQDPAGNVSCDTFKLVETARTAQTTFEKGDKVVLKALVGVGQTAQIYFFDGAKYVAQTMVNNEATITMPEGDIIIKAVVTSSGTSTVKAEADAAMGSIKVLSSGTEVANSISGSTGSVYAGNTVTFEIKTASSDYELAKVELNGSDITDKYYKGVTIDTAGYTYTFKAIFKAVDEYDYTITAVGPGGILDINGNPAEEVGASAKEKDDLLCIVSPETDKKVKSITLNGVEQDLSKIMSGNNVYFKMPGEKLNVVVTFGDNTVTALSNMKNVDSIKFSKATFTDGEADKNLGVKDNTTVKMFIKVSDSVTPTSVVVNVGGTSYTANTTTDTDALINGYKYEVSFIVNNDVTPTVTVATN